jgi:DNA repair protein RecN (Recombination protein N)
LHIRKGALAKSLTKEPSVVTRVAVLDEIQRREEIARMLSGATITDEARAAAAQLIKNSK